MTKIDIAAKLHDVLIKQPAAFWTGKDPAQATALDALPVYAVAAFPPLLLLGLTGCSGEEEDGAACDDGATRSTYGGSSKTRGQGICRDKVEVCIDGRWTTTQQQILPREEVEGNGIDDNCDGLFDECPEGDLRSSYAGPEETRGVGVCRDRLEQCLDGTWQLTQDERIPEPEIAQNLEDDDCDGATDECADGDEQRSYAGPEETRGVGACLDRVEACADGAWELMQEEALPQAEIAQNGLDDNCDGWTDECAEGETASFYAGPDQTRGVGACRDRIDLCTSGIWQTVQQEVLPSTDIAGNAIDEDCSGIADDCQDGTALGSYSGPAWTQNVGICLGRIDICSGGSWQLARDEVLPREEIEDNGLDDDCDGMTDECPEGATVATYSGPAATRGVGACRDHVDLCASGAWQVFEEELLPREEVPANGLDDDCDGKSDECADGATKSSYTGSAATRGIGACRDQIERCDAGAWSTTQAQVLPRTEVASNGLDDDCDGKTDECAEGTTRTSYAGPAETRGIGICRDQIDTCSAGVWTMTRAQTLPQTEIAANGLDDDCDGRKDECAVGTTRTAYTGPAETRNVGACREQIDTCTTASWLTTQTQVLPAKEILGNKIDDDCDGFIDEIDISGTYVGINDCSITPAFIRLQNGAKLAFTCTNVTVEAASIEIDATSTLEITPSAGGVGDGASGSGVEDGGGAGGGGGLSAGGPGGRGGHTGTGGAAGLAHGSANDFVAETGGRGGTGGGPYGGKGGGGGGALKLVAANAWIYGTISLAGSNGSSAPYDDGGGSGGGGGGLVGRFGTLTTSPASTRILVNGGSGGNGGGSYARGGGGGGGGGGTIELSFTQATIAGVGTYASAQLADFHARMQEVGCYNLSGGQGGSGHVAGGNGAAGAVNSVMP